MEHLHARTPEYETLCETGRPRRDGMATCETGRDGYFRDGAAHTSACTTQPVSQVAVPSRLASSRPVPSRPSCLAKGPYSGVLRLNVQTWYQFMKLENSQQPLIMIPLHKLPGGSEHKNSQYPQFLLFLNQRGDRIGENQCLWLRIANRDSYGAPSVIGIFFYDRYPIPFTASRLYCICLKKAQSTLANWDFQWNSLIKWDFFVKGQPQVKAWFGSAKLLAAELRPSLKVPFGC